MRKAVFVLLIIILGCQSPYISPYYLEGEWTDFQENTIHFSNNSITINFKNDSFYYYNKRWTDSHVVGDSCSVYDGDEYACGVYKIQGYSILLKGKWTDKTYKNVKMSGCYNDNDFEIKYSYNIKDYKNIKLVIKERTYLYKYSTGIKDSVLLTKK